MQANKMSKCFTAKSSLAQELVIAGIVLTGMTGICAGGLARPVQAASLSRTTMDGIYTDDQAKRGKMVYQQNCSSCHMEDLSGSDQALALAGDSFTAVWNGQSVEDLFELIHTSMPQDRPGSLTPEAAINVVTYLLQCNKFPSGTEELKKDSGTLRAITITKDGNAKQ